MAALAAAGRERDRGEHHGAHARTAREPPTGRPRQVVRPYCPVAVRGSGAAASATSCETTAAVPMTNATSDVLDLTARLLAGWR